MKYIESYKIFDSYKSERKNLILRNILSKKVGEIVDEDDIYVYVESLHHTPSDFIDGDLADRIEEYSSYKLIEINLDDLDLDEFYIDEEEVDSFKEVYLKTRIYPPIVIDDEYGIIDGIHRANSIYEAGESKILAFIGIN